MDGGGAMDEQLEYSHQDYPPDFGNEPYRVASTRRRSRRSVVLLILGAVLILAAGIGAFAILRDASTASPDTAQQSPTPTASAITPPPALPAVDFAFPAPPASASKLGPWTTAAAAPFPGKALFFTGQSQSYGVAVLSDGALRRSSLGSLDPNTSCILQTYAFSPDGTHIVWVRGNLNGNSKSQLVSTDLATLKASALADDVWCVSVGWRANSREITYVKTGPGDNKMLVSLDTGTATLSRGFGSYFAVVPGYTAYNDNGAIVVEDTAGKVVHRVPYVGWEVGFSVQALSYDGRYVGVNFENTDPGRVVTVARVVDTTTGKEIAIPLSDGEHLMTLAFVPDGGMVLQTLAGADVRMRRLDANGRVVASIDLPDDLGPLGRYVA
jgi:hypothetical protein